MTAPLDPTPLSVRSASGEPGYGLLNRLALRHGAPSAQALAEQLAGVNLGWVDEVSKGRGLDRLAALTGVAFGDLHRATVRTEGVSAFLGNVPLTIRVVSNCVDYGRVCVDCLDEDMEVRLGPDACRPARRAVWDITPLVACERHGRPLVSSCPECGERVGKHWLDPRRCPAGHAVRRHPDPVGIVGGHKYLLRRLAGQTGLGGPFLDGLGVSDAGHAMVAIGMTRLHGRVWPRLRDQPASRIMEALDLGFESLSAWPDGVFAVLDDLHCGSARKRNGPSRMYGSLAFWLRHAGGASYETLAELVVQHYARAGSRTPHLWARGRDDLWETTWSLARELDVDRSRLEDFARALDLEREFDHGQPRVSPDAARRLRGILADAERGRRAAAHRLGVTLGHFKLLRKAMVVAPLWDGNRAIYDGTVLDAIVRRCVAGAPRAVGVRGDTVSLVDAAKRTNRRLPMLIQALETGRLAIAEVAAEERGLRSIRVSVGDVIASVPRSTSVDGGTGPDLLGIDAGASRLGVTRWTVERLIEAGPVRPLKTDVGRAFDIQALDALLAACRDGAQMTAIPPPGVFPLAQAGSRAGRSIAAMVAAIIAGRLAARSVLPCATGLNAVCVSVEDVRRVVPRRDDIVKPTEAPRQNLAA